MPKHTNRWKGVTAGVPHRFINHHHIRGERHPFWKNRRFVAGEGYVFVFAPDHSRADKKGYIREHVLIVERALGHPLRSTAPIHHVNEIKTDNRNENLVACNDHAYHALLHTRMRAFLACGDPNARPCKICGSYEDQGDIVPTKSKQTHHRECERIRSRARYAEKMRMRKSYLMALTPDDVEAAIAASNALPQDGPSSALPCQMREEEILAEYYAQHERVLGEFAASMGVEIE